MGGGPKPGRGSFTPKLGARPRVIERSSQHLDCPYIFACCEGSIPSIAIDVANFGSEDIFDELADLATPRGCEAEAVEADSNAGRM